MDDVLVDDVLDVEDLAKIYKTSKNGIHTRRNRNPESLPPSFKLGGRVVWRRTTVEAWLQEEERRQTNPRRRRVG